MSLVTVVPEIDVAHVQRAVVRTLEPYGPRERVLPPDVAEATSERGLHCRCRIQTMPGLGDLRVLAATGPGVHVLHVVSMPRPDRDVGVFHAELVHSDNDDTSLAIDVHTVSGTAHARAASVRVLDRALSHAGIERVRSEGSGAFGRSRYAIDRSKRLDDIDTTLAALTTAWALQVYELVLAPRLDMRQADQHFAKLNAWRTSATERLAGRGALEGHFGAAWTARVIGSHLLS